MLQANLELVMFPETIPVSTETIITEWYVLTGGPSSGKTKTINHLAYMGHRVIPEAARVLIDEELSRGKPLKEIRGNGQDFQRKILNMIRSIEDVIPADQSTFLDRGLPDSMVYYELCGLDPMIVRNVMEKRRYKKVFFLEQLPFEKDYARVENHEIAREVGEKLYNAYIDCGYEVVRVPVMPISDRVKFIESHM